MELFNWAKQYIKFSVSRKYKNVKIEEKDKYILVSYKSQSGKTEKIKFFVFENLNKGLNSLDEKDLSKEKINIICSNLKENVEELVLRWDSLITKSNLIFIFVESSINNKWLIRPHSHHLIAEKSNLREGLLSLYRSAKIA